MIRTTERRSKHKCVWVGPWIPSAKFDLWPAASPAAIKWQYHLLTTLSQLGVSIDFIYYKPDSFWPKGHLLPWTVPLSQISEKIPMKELKYINFPGIRSFTLEKSLIQIFSQTKNNIDNNKKIVFSYNAPDWLSSAITRQKKLEKLFWIAVVADGDAPQGADAYVFLSYGYYMRFPSIKKLHLDGGVYPVEFSTSKSNFQRNKTKKLFLYSGSLGKWGGVELLLDTLGILKRNDFELILTGPPPIGHIREKIDRDHRVRYLGLLTDHDLIKLYSQVDFFVNPRPNSSSHEKNNFPSKLLDYLAWNKPILSTRTDGLAPYYNDKLEFFEDNIDSLAKAIEHELDSPQSVKARVGESRDWQYHGRRLLKFLDGIS